MEVRIGAPGLAIEAGEAVVAVGAGLFAIVAADAQVLVDQQHVGRLADAVLDEEARGFRIKVDRAGEIMLAALDEGVDLVADLHVGAQLVEQPRLGAQQPGERLALEPDHLGLDRGLDRRGALAPRDQRHLADIGAGGEIVRNTGPPADALLDDHAPHADHEDVLAFLALGEDRWLARTVRISEVSSTSARSSAMSPGSE